MSETKPYRVDCLDHDSWSIVRDGKMVLCSIPTKTHAGEICAALNSAFASGLAAGRGEGEKMREALEEIAQDEQSGYGYYKGGDPRMFHPDSESCSPEELAAHKKACDEWTEAENAAKPSPDAPCPSGWVGPNIHVTVAPFGIGCYTYPSHTAILARSALNSRERVGGE